MKREIYISEKLTLAEQLVFGVMQTEIVESYDDYSGCGGGVPQEYVEEYEFEYTDTVKFLYQLYDYQLNIDKIISDLEDKEFVKIIRNNGKKIMKISTIGKV